MVNNKDLLGDPSIDSAERLVDSNFPLPPCIVYVENSEFDEIAKKVTVIKFFKIEDKKVEDNQLVDIPLSVIELIDNTTVTPKALMDSILGEVDEVDEEDEVDETELQDNNQ